MRVRLVHVPKFVAPHGTLDAVFVNIPAMGLYGLADVLDRRGHDARLVHLGVERLLLGRAGLADTVRAEGGVDLVGFSLHWHHQLASTLAEIEAFHAAYPEVPIVVGGLTASIFAAELLERAPGVTWVIRGEGEQPLVALVEALESGRGLEAVPNLSRRVDGRVVHAPASFHATPASWAKVAYGRPELLPGAPGFSPRYSFDARAQASADYANPRRLFYLETGRGCTRSCAFCGGGAAAYRQFFGRPRPGFRAWDDVLADLVRLQQAGYDAVYVSYDPPPISDAYYSVLFNRAFREGLTLQMEFEAFDLHTPVFWDGFANAFGRAGTRVAFSPEVADAAVRRRFKGFGYANADLEANVRHLAGLGVTSVLYFTLFPGTTPDQARAMRDWHDELRARYGAEILTMPIEMEPGAPWHLVPARWGLEGARRTFDAFLARHRDVQTVGRDLPTELGYRFDEVDALLAIVTPPSAPETPAPEPAAPAEPGPEPA